jgi:hypothetical protein
MSRQQNLELQQQEAYIGYGREGTERVSRNRKRKKNGKEGE